MKAKLLSQIHSASKVISDLANEQGKLGIQYRNGQITKAQYDKAYASLAKKKSKVVGRQIAAKDRYKALTGCGNQTGMIEAIATKLASR